MINKAILLGRVGKDPEFKSGNGGNVARFSLATSESWKDKNTGEKKENTEWHNIIAFEPLANVVRDWVKKGDKLYIEGKITTNKWTDQQGIERHSTSIQAQTLKMLESKNKSESQSCSNQNQNAQESSFVDDQVPF